MCWSARVSFATCLFVAGICYYLWNRKHKYDRMLVCIIATYTMIQLWEGFLWLNNNQCNSMNLILTTLLYVTLWCHVLGVGAGIYVEQKDTEPLWIGMLVLFFGLLIMPKILCTTVAPSTLTSECGYQHLIWGFDSNMYYIVFLVAIGIILYYVPRWKGLLMISPWILTLCLSSVLHNYNHNLYGSYWCWISAITAFVFVLIN